MSKKFRGVREFFKIALYYATDSMLFGVDDLEIHSDANTPKYQHDALENFNKNIFLNDTNNCDLSDKRLF